MGRVALFEPGMHVAIRKQHGEARVPSKWACLLEGTASEAAKAKQKGHRHCGIPFFCACKSSIF